VNSQERRAHQTSATDGPRPHDGPAGHRLERDARRVVIEHVQPRVDGGRFPVKRTPGETVAVTADVFGDGHDQLAGVLKFRRPQGIWQEIALAPIGNDSWGASFVVSELGEYEYAVEAWVDRFGTWLAGLIAKTDAGQDVASELLEGAEIVQAAAVTDNNLRLLEIADTLRTVSLTQAARVAVARDALLAQQMAARPERSTATVSNPVLRVTVDPERARFSAWYEMFPRSCTTDPARGGTFRDAEARLPEIAAMGFDVLYLPPIHPIGQTHRKGRNNALTAAPADPGSPWAIGAAAGGHTAIDPGLGSLEDFERFVAASERQGMAVALDIAFQASPDHPWVTEHPEWFRHRPDGSIKYAENPPKKYQDIYPFDFESPDWPALWDALRDVFLFWLSHGVRIFRVDNPHTKSFGFWEWVIADLRRRHPEAIFLAEAFTRPKLMRYLAKAGFSQSYTYFTWRNSASELREYLTELTQTELQQYMRPNFFANTPDILHEYLQTGGKPAFEARLILAATLSASYGIYSGFELCENTPVRQGSEEYLNSEKYAIRVRNWHQPGNLSELIARVNEIRREHPALQFNDTLRFHDTNNPALLWFSKQAAGDRVFVAANTDPHSLQHGHVRVPTLELGLGANQSYIVEDLLDGATYVWSGDWNYVRLEPSERMAHIFVVRGPGEGGRG
jgi:starch synthase (maltosyl-transferring)